MKNQNNTIGVKKQINLIEAVSRLSYAMTDDEYLFIMKICEIVLSRVEVEAEN